MPSEVTITRGFFHSFHGTSSYATYLLGSGGWIRFARGKGGDITGGGLLESQQQTGPNATARMTTESRCDTERLQKATDTDPGAP